MDELSSHAAQLRAAMAGPQTDADWSGGVRSACAELTPGELGALLPAACRTLADERATDHARRVAREVTWAEAQPSFSAATLTELYAALAASPRPTDVRFAAGALLPCTEPWDREALAEHAALLVRVAGPKADRAADAALAVASLAGRAVEEELTAQLRVLYTDSPLRLAELEVMLTTGARDRARIAEDRRYGPVSGDWPPLPDHDAEPSDARYPELARQVLRTAAEHLAAVHAGRIPYAADKAFTPADTETLRRAAQLALRRDEPWAEEVFATLLPQLAVAPTSARTLPSQGACIALAQAVEAYPTPEAVAALREARRVVRHGGVSKKLDRLLRHAERRLGRRTQIALRLPDPDPEPSAGIRLWHPARATQAERRTWRDRIVALRLRQPFRQVYREQYLPEGRAALRRILAEHIASGRIELGDRHLHLDGYDIHLATGRVTREGDPVDIAPPTGRRAAPLPFLPYDEALLESVVHTVSHLLESGPVPHREGTG
ncbi:DUF4132 domain-containing protein [Streptomyces tubercidicus]